MILPYNKDMQKTDISDENENISLRKILSSNIRTLRGKYHLTQERLAENAEISLPYLSDIEHCKTWVSDKTLLKFAKALNTTPATLLEYDSEKKETLSKEDQITEIIYQEKKEMIKAINKIYDDTIQKILGL